jgi:hypothetical protein
VWKLFARHVRFGDRQEHLRDLIRFCGGYRTRSAFLISIVPTRSCTAVNYLPLRQTNFTTYHSSTPSTQHTCPRIPSSLIKRFLPGKSSKLPLNDRWLKLCSANPSGRKRTSRLTTSESLAHEAVALVVAVQVHQQVEESSSNLKSERGKAAQRWRMIVKSSKGAAIGEVLKVISQCKVPHLSCTIGYK